MNLLRISLTLILLVMSCFTIHAQESPQTKLVDEIGGLQCEFLWASLDGFVAELKARPGSFATIEISGKIGERLTDFYWDGFIRSHLSRVIPATSFKIVRTALANERRVKLWLTPAGAPLPEIKPAVWSFVYPSNTKPFIFTNGHNYSVETGVCIDVDEIGLLSSALNANPRARVHVVLIVRSEREFQRRKRLTLRMLTRDYSISSSRIKLFKKVTRKANPYRIDPVAEFWFVP